MGRRKGASPYEIMSRVQGPSTNGRRDRPRTADRPSNAGGWLSRMRGWLGFGLGHKLKTAAGEPVQLSVSRGLLGVAAGLGLVALVAAFVAGVELSEASDTAGRSDANTADGSTSDPAGVWLTPPDPTVQPYIATGPGSDTAEDDAPGGSPRVAIPTTDPRVPGLNYLAIVTTTPEEARRIQGFFADHGVETFITKPHNTGLVQLIDVSRGFTREQYRSGEQADHRASRLALGRAWKHHNKGIGDNLSKMYFTKYVAPQD